MSFSVDVMKYPVYYPNPDLLEKITSSSEMKTIKKVKSVMGDLVFPKSPIDRPYLYGCMVLSFDGKMGFFDNPEGTLISKENAFDKDGALTDFWVMNVARAYSDAVILGTGTLKARLEKLWYANIADEELIQERKALDKKTKEPLNIIASIDGKDVPVEARLFKELDNKPIIFTTMSGGEYLKENMDVPTEIITEPKGLFDKSDTVRVIAIGNEIPDTKEILKFLRRGGVEYVSVEAPGYIWQLIKEELLDEYLLNYSGVMVGGNVAVGTWSGFNVEKHPHVALLSIGFKTGFVFTRQKLIYDL